MGVVILGIDHMGVVILGVDHIEEGQLLKCDKLSRKWK